MGFSLKSRTYQQASLPFSLLSLGKSMQQCTLPPSGLSLGKTNFNYLIFEPRTLQPFPPAVRWLLAQLCTSVFAVLMSLASAASSSQGKKGNPCLARGVSSVHVVCAAATPVPENCLESCVGTWGVLVKCARCDLLRPAQVLFHSSGSILTRGAACVTVALHFDTDVKPCELWQNKPS